MPRPLFLLLTLLLIPSPGAPAAQETAPAASTPVRPRATSSAPVSHADLWSDDEPTDTPASALSVVQPAGWVSPAAFQTASLADTRRFSSDFVVGSRRFNVGVDLYSAPEFEGGLIVFGPNIAMKIGGFVKADFIYDFNPIESTDFFDTTTIQVGEQDRTNSRFHARQTRLSFDTRWASRERVVRIFVEGDFFGNNDHFRLRHGYGEVGRLLVGRTWTTFSDVAAAPATLDFEGSVSNIDRRAAQARWTQPIWDRDLTVAVAIEDPVVILQLPPGRMADPRTPSPDVVAHLKLDKDWGKFQIAGLYRLVGGQERGEPVRTDNAWGLNFTATILLTDVMKVYGQAVFGEGIGSYRGLPDVVPDSPDTLTLLPMFGWMVGLTRDWNDRWSSNFTWAENRLDNTGFQPGDDVHSTTYLAANLIWNPLDRVRLGAEYLYGVRENVDGASDAAHRIQASFIFDLP